MTSWRVTNDINIYLKQMYQTRAKTRKYLLYFAQGGWANQQRCLKNAYAMARILDRTLLLPPVLPHGLWGYTSQRTVLTADQGHFKPKNDSSTDPLFLYLERLPAKRYMPMSQVLDINFSLPDIPTLDVRDFHQRYYHENLTTSTIEIDYGYSHFNTTWVHKKRRLEGKVVNVHKVEYGSHRTDARTYRDLYGTLGNDPTDILVFLDTFVAPYHETVREAVPSWRPRLAPSIVHAVKDTVAKWPPYAAIHLRTGDGPFKLRVEQTIRDSFQGVTAVIMDWLDANRLRNRHENIALYVATDLDNFREHDVFAAAAANLTNAVYQSHHVNLVVLSLENVGNATEVLGGILYSDIFLDMQIATCAPIGFQMSYFSSFSDMISTYRLSDSVC